MPSKKVPPGNSPVDGSDIDGGVNMSQSTFAGRDINGLTAAELREILEVVLKHFPKSSLDPAALDKTLSELRELHEKLHEWKELHNRLDRLMTAYGQYLPEVEQYHAQRLLPDARHLKRRWMPVNFEVDRLVTYAASTQSLEKQYKILPDGRQTRFEIVVDIAVHSELMNKHLESATQIAASETTILNRVFRTIPVSALDWKETLYDVTKLFGHLGSSCMTWADDNLRVTATELYTISKSIGSKAE